MPTKTDLEKLDRFELISELASGGMATVYLARLGGAGGFQRLFAIKRLHPHLAHDGEFIQMFLDEARLAARIHHPNVVPIQEIGTSERGYYLVMDFIEGDTAARVFAKAAQRGSKIAPNVGIRIVLDALAGLHASHELKDVDGKPLEIVHRDVSPQNILVGVDGVARLTDFGVARAASRLSTTRTGQLKGKLAYMAPEQARSKAFVDRRADLFAMGIVLWETLAFRRLFKGDSEAETLNRVLYEPIPTLRSAAPTIPASLDAIVNKALERDPEKRFQTAQELADALEKAAHALHVLGTQREVAQVVQDLMGTEIEQQREVVRAWLARSEPSRNNDSRNKVAAAPPPSGGRGNESVTRVERAAPSLTPPPGVSSVSSVSSAAVHVPPTPPSSAILESEITRAELSEDRQPSPSRGRRAWAWSIALGGVSLAIAWGVVAWKSAPLGPRATASRAAPVTQAATPLPPMAPTAFPILTPNPTPADAPVATPTPTSHDPSPAFPGPVAPRDAGSDSGSAKPAPAPPRHRRLIQPQASPPPAVPTSAPPPADTAPAAPTVPDDITRNPYR